MIQLVIPKMIYYFEEKARILEKLFLLFLSFSLIAFYIFPYDSHNIFFTTFPEIFNFFCRYFFNLLTFQNPFKINGFPIFFTCYFIDMLTLLLYYNRYSTFCWFMWNFVASWHRYICFYIQLISILLITYTIYTHDFPCKTVPDRRYQECICLS